MKKLFTLLALLACFMGAKADEIVDKSVDFSKMTDVSEVQWYSWGGSGREKFEIADGSLHFSQDEPTADDWGVQVFPIGGVEAEAGKTYYLELKIKGSGYQYKKHTDQETQEVIVDDPGACVHNVVFQVGGTNYDNFDAITPAADYEVVTIPFECPKDGELHILFQCGSWVGDLWIEYMKIYHEGKAPAVRVWENILENGDAEGEYGEVACAWEKVFGVDPGDDGQGTPHAAPIVELDGGKVFLSHHAAVDPPLLWEEAGSQWGQSHEAGDPMPDNAWQNQFFITAPEGIKAGEQLRLKFKYKASEAGVKADIQTHAMPGNYIGGFTPGSLTFGTDWDTFEAEFSAPTNDAGAVFQSIAFNLGVGEQYTKDIDFYFDDLEISTLVLEHGFFVAASDIDDRDPDYDFDNAIQFEDAGTGDGLLVATVGTRGDENSWVNQAIISTVRGDDKAFKAAALKTDHAPKNDPADWNGWSEVNGAKIDFPVKGVWRILLDPGEGEGGEKVMSFEKIEGEVDAEPVDIVTNTSEYLTEATDRSGADWDNQFWIMANREFKGGEETHLVFEYRIDTEEAVEVTVSTQWHSGTPGDYKGETNLPLTFTEEWQEFSEDLNPGAGIQSFAFNMSVAEKGYKYLIRNVKWYQKDAELNAQDKTYENYISADNQENFYVKTLGTDPTRYDQLEPQQQEFSIYDINQDGKVNLADVRKIINLWKAGEEGYNLAFARKAINEWKKAE